MKRQESQVDIDMREIVDYALSLNDEHTCFGAFKMYFALIFAVPSLFLPVLFYNLFACCCTQGKLASRWCGMVGSVPGFILTLPVAAVALLPALVIAIVLSPCTRLNKRVQFH